jgi:hypothetical protein
MSGNRPDDSLSDQGERRTPRRGTLTLAQIIERFEQDADCHTAAGPSGEDDLRRMEDSIGHRLPDAFREFLARLGGGLFYQGHEIFGPQRTMIHDIELVPDLVTIRQRLLTEGNLPAGGLVPFHRARGVINLMDVRDEAGAGRILSARQRAPFPDLASFLETVVLPRDRRSAPERTR